MKLVLFFALIIASVNAFAAQVPRAVDQVPRAIEDRMLEPPRVRTETMLPPPPSSAPLYQPNNDELTNLLRAQTAAIKSLSSKLESLETRIAKIEEVQR